MPKKLPKYRNIQDFRINEFETIDAGSLWRLIGDKLFLVDDDHFVETDLDLNLFEKL